MPIEHLYLALAILCIVSYGHVIDTVVNGQRDRSTVEIGETTLIRCDQWSHLEYRA